MNLLCLSLILFLSIGNLRAFVPKSFKMNFREEHKSTLGNRLKKASGVIYYQYPKKIRVEVLKPSVTTFVSNSLKSWYYTAPFLTGEPGEVTISPSKDYFLIKIFDLLQNKLSNNKIFKVKKKSKYIKLIFRKKTSLKINLQKIIFYFTEASKKSFNNLIKMETFDSRNRKKVFYFSKQKTNAKLSKNIFNFLIPPNTRKNH